MTEVNTAGHTQIRSVTVVVLLTYMGQMTLNPIIAPLARELGLAEWQIGLMISTAAVMVVVTSRSWGRRAQTHGARRVLLRAVGIAAAAMLGFVLVSWAGMAGLIGSTALFLVIVALRGVAFGAAIAAVPTTARTYVARTTATEEGRVKGMAGIGAAQGLAMVFGSVLGGALSGLGLLIALGAVPVLLVVALVVVRRLRPEAPGEAIVEPSPVDPFDPRVWPFLVAGFGMFTALGLIACVYMIRFVVAIGVGMHVVATTSATQLSVAFRAWRIPRAISVTLAVMLRFFPVVASEAAAVLDAMRLRGLAGPAGFLRHPILSLERFTVPVIAASLRAGEDLSASAILRGLGSRRTPTSINPPRFGVPDLALVLAVLGLTAGTLLAPGPLT